MDVGYPSPHSDAWRSLCNVVDYSGIFDSEKRQPHSRCMQNTRVALLESLRQILDRNDRTNIWINGLASVGKTSIAFSVAEELKAAGRLVATFFFSDKHAQSASKIIPTIAYQLALAFPRTRDDIVKAIEKDQILLLPDKSRRDQMRELVINPLRTLKFRQEPYAIAIDALDECCSADEAARLATLLIDTLSVPDLPFIHLIFTSRPGTHLRTAMQTRVHEISLTTRDADTVQDVRFFLQTSLDNIRKSRSTIFDQPSKAWPSADEFEILAFKAGGLFVYAAMATNFISATGHHPQRRLNLLLHEKSTVSADIDQLYRQILATSENPDLHCRLLASIIHLARPLSLAELQELFHADKEDLAVMLESFSPVLLNPPDGIGPVEIYHDSVRDFMIDPGRSKQYHVDYRNAHEHLTCCCIDVLIRTERMHRGAYPYAHMHWGLHLALAYPSSKLRLLLAHFTEKIVALPEQLGPPVFTRRDLHRVKVCCLSTKCMKKGSDIAIAWRIIKTSKKIDKILNRQTPTSMR